MSNKQHTNSLADRFSEFGSVPTDAVWDAIDTKLSEQGSKKRGMIFWISANAAMIGLIIFSVCMPSTKNQTTANVPPLSSHAENKHSVEKSAPTKENSAIKPLISPEEATEYAYLLETPAHAWYAQKSVCSNQGTSENPSTEPRVNAPLEVSENALENALKSSVKIDSLSTKRAFAFPSHSDRTVASCIIIPPKKFHSLELGVRAASFSTINEWKKTKITAFNEPFQTSAGITSIDQGNYVHFVLHDRLFEFEAFARTHYRRFYGTLGVSFAKTRVKEIYGNYVLGVREFVSKEIMSVGAPLSLGYNVIDRARFQFAFSCRLLPEYSFLTKYEKMIDAPSFVSTQIPAPAYSSPGGTEITKDFTLGMEPHISMNFKLNERIDAFGQFGYRTGLIRSSLFSNHFRTNFTTFSVGTVVRL